MAKSDKKKQKLFNGIRLAVIIAILIFMTVIGILHQVLTVNKPAGVDALCPFGGLESLITVVFTGTMLQRIALSSFILLIAVVIVTLLFRRSFCGSICPLGTLQELFGRLGRKIFGKSFIMPAAVDKWARYLKYLLLVLIMVFSYIAGALIIRPYDPWATYQHLFSVDLFAEFTIGLVVLILTLAGSLFFDRFFCKYFCPMGAFTGLLGKISLFRIKRNTETCIDCGACDKACPVNIEVSSLKQVTSAECIQCLECVNSCPVQDTLEIKAGKKFRLNPLTVLFITLGVFVAAILVSGASQKVEWGVPSLSSTVSKLGTLDVEEIKGSMSFKEVADVSGITKEQFMEEFKFAAEEFTKPIKDIKGKYGFEMEEVKAFVEENLL